MPSEKEWKTFWRSKFPEARASIDTKSRYLNAITFTYEISLRRIVSRCAEEYAKGDDILERAMTAANSDDSAALDKLWSDYEAHSARVVLLNAEAEETCR